MRHFQSAFLQALHAPDDIADAPMRALAMQPAFAVYRNTVMKGCVDALEANFPAVAQLVGADWFRAAAATYARRHPPDDARLLVYGDAGFGSFLQELPTTRRLPYLAGIAQLDTLWRAAHAAADAPVLGPAALAGSSPESFATRLLVPHPAARWAAFDDMPVATIWSRARERKPMDDTLPWRGDGVLLTRPHGSVVSQPLDTAGRALLDACRSGLPLGDAAVAVLDKHPATDLGALFQQLLQSGAYADPQAAHPT